MELGGRNVYFGTGSDLLYVRDVATGDRRDVEVDDVAKAMQLCDALPNIDFVMSLGHPRDVDPHLAYLLSFRAMFANCSKPLVVTAEGREDLAVMWQAACDLRAGARNLVRKPYFIVYNEPVSPLQHGFEAVDKTLYCAEKRIPVVYTPCPMAGATAPITSAGFVAQALAESLLGLVLVQLKAPGAPFIVGSAALQLDLATAQCVYTSVEACLTHTVMVEMTKWLDLPNFGFGGHSDSQLVDAQAGLELAEITLLDMLAGSNLTHDVGYLDFGRTGSLEEVAIVDEFVEMNKRLLSGVRVTRDTLALDTVSEVGPGGNFLGTKHTARHHREAQWRPRLLNRTSHENWVRTGGMDLEKRASLALADIIKEQRNREPQAPEQVLVRLTQAIDEYARGIEDSGKGSEGSSGAGPISGQVQA